ncbi:unnamed protein product [Allacma fusca]|uniref:Uncharacterized protein n=1 Tax=Allacma fusca TaxID=39272 RepID=A0A8J2JFX7_9HEXA|nr:unnamed protein product [Allacma fusca]
MDTGTFLGLLRVVETKKDPCSGVTKPEEWSAVPPGGSSSASVNPESLCDHTKPKYYQLPRINAVHTQGCFQTELRSIN